MANRLKRWLRDRCVGLVRWGSVVGIVGAAHVVPGPWAWQIGEVEVWHLLLGVLVALVVGHYAAQAVVVAMRPEQDPEGLQRGAVVGLVERGALAGVVTLALAWAVIGPWVGGWVAVKLGLNWQTRLKENGKNARVGAMSALAATVVSLTFAVAGGLLIGASLPS